MSSCIGVVWRVLVATVVFFTAGCRADIAAEGNLLAGLLPIRSERVAHAELLTDGAASVNGGIWLSDLTAKFESSNAFVEYDLGAPSAFTAVYLQGDHNDEYVLSASDDGVDFAPFWVAPPQDQGGMQSRASADLNGHGRYLRLSAGRGDGRFTVSEVQIFATRPAVFPPRVPLYVGLDVHDAMRGAVLLVAAMVALFLVSTARAFPRWAPLPMAALIGMAGYRLAETVRTAWPLESLDVALVRATVAALAALAVGASVFWASRFRPHPRALLGVLAVLTLASMGAFYNLGQPQAFDRSSNTPTIVHHYDMRVYFPIAKYFEELRFDGLYMASVAAYVDDDAGATYASLASTELRDLETLRMTRVRDVEDKIRAVQRRFSEGRWQAFKRDMRYFRQAMGPADYLGTLTDHGGNATPVWFTMARVLFAWLPASDAVLTATAMLDPLLLVVMFAMVGRAFGARTMLVVAILFGANDFYMFGTNWAGATLRHDWIAFLGMGLAALKLERWRLGGALLAFSAMIRAFPALALIGAALPALWSIGAARDRSNPRWFFDALKTHRDLGRVVVGAVGCALLLGVVSCVVFSPDAWIDWLRKVAALDHDPAVNETSLRAILAGSGGDQQRILRARWPLYALSLALSVLGVVFAARGKKMFRAATLALVLVPVIFNPANYYLHYFCLLPLAFEEVRGPRGGDAPAISPRHAAAWLVLLAVCVAQFWTVTERDVGLHFVQATVLFFAASAWLVASAARENVATPEPNEA